MRVNRGCDHQWASSYIRLARRRQALGGGSWLKSPLPIDGISDLVDLHMDLPAVDVASTGSPHQKKLNDSDHNLSPER